MKTHPSESLPAYVLGALDADEANEVAAHLRACPACRAEAEEFRAVVDTLPDTAALDGPPPHVKQQLFARIAADRRPAVRVGGMSIRLPSLSIRSMAALTLAVLACALVLTAMVVDARRRLDGMAQELRDLQQGGEPGPEQAVVAAFLSDPATLAQPLQSGQPGITGTMYMQPASQRAVLVVHGLQPPAPGQRYQFWFASGERQIPAATFTVAAGGTAQVVLDAPGPVGGYSEVMVTVEPAAGSARPSSTVVLAAKIRA